MVEYINEIRGFYDYLEENSLSTGQIALWHALMCINNKSYWQEWFSVANKSLISKTSMTRQGIYTARNALKQKGLIDFRETGPKATEYKIIRMKEFYNNGCKPAQDMQLFDTNCCSSVDKALTINCSSVDNPLTNSYKKVAHYKTKDKDKDKDTDKDKDRQSCVSPYKISELFNSVCVSFTRIDKLSEERKKAVKSLMAEYSFDEVRNIFEKAEASSFLKGFNDMKWKADFDWLIKPVNVDKVLGGRYDNRQADGFDPFSDSFDHSKLELLTRR